MQDLDLLKAVENRHSVRQYLDLPIEQEKIDFLNGEIQKINSESGLNIQLFTNEHTTFKSFLAKYGKFENAFNFFALVGENTLDLDQKVGYYGEKLVLLAQSLNLNSCWVALTFNKKKCPAKIEQGQRLAIVVSLGYGKTQGVLHKQKPFENFCKAKKSTLPDWFIKGVECAMLCPTAINQQKFYFEYCDEKVKASTRKGPCSKIDLGIAKFHFELGANKNSNVWIDN